VYLSFIEGEEEISLQLYSGGTDKTHRHIHIRLHGSILLPLKGCRASKEQFETDLDDFWRMEAKVR